ncbi:phage tail protein [Pseudomonas proteolytica]|uniref:tail fiber assembly protein n=1 Tax=Pseudomonas proteolytica TaxID=219574 RepID=UPI0023DF6497|nr:tail fiber assembly protein [Pseudomonas proteolytica]MDF3162844.1 phage tail protein [Pseudomonas proteolytica]
MIEEKTETPDLIYFSATDNGFLFIAEREAYDAAGTWPSDAVAVSEEEWQTYGQQSPPQGMRRGSDDQGRPMWIKPEVTPEDAVAQERAWRDRQLITTDSWVTRHRDQVEIGRGTTLTSEAYRQLQVFRLELRDWPMSEHFPDIEHRPVVPDWIADANL